jgi:MtrB/PioB family decaheme-associated outer membrane protein
MDTHIRYSFPLTVALLAAFWPTAQASDEAEIYRLITPESTISSFGVGYVGNNNQYFGEYNGMNQRGAYGLLDAYVVKRNNETGTWYKFTTSNLGLEDRDIRWEQERQGDWGYSLDFSQIPRYNPLTVTTGLAGIGTTTQTINGLPMQNVQLDTKRKRFTLDLNKFLPAGYDFQVRYRHEDKDGSRMYGQGVFGTVNFLAEPINQTTQQVDAILNYTGEDLQLSGGYYGTWFDNQNTALNVIGGIAAFSPMALPPGNQSHQANLTGGYNFTPTTRGNFKAAYTYQIQDQGFVVPAITGTSNLGGKLDTTLVQAGLTSQLMPKLSVLANVRYEYRNDKTPVYQYFTGTTPTSTLDGTNEPRTLKTIDSKLEASYMLPMGFRFTGGGNYVVQQRNEFAIRSVSFRDKTYETNYRAELRRALSETVTGAVSYVHSDRWGSPFLTTVRLNNTPGSNNIAPLNLANRTADTVKVTTNWTPTESLSFQVFGSGGWVDYSSRNNQDLGLRSGQTKNYGADTTYVFTEKLQANAWYSRNDNRTNQVTCVSANAAGGACLNTAAAPVWEAWLRNVSDTYGVGVKGKVTGKLEVGTDVEYSNIRDHYPMASLVPAGASIGSIPNINTQIFDVKLSAKYALRNNMGFRFNYIYNRFTTNDYTWNNWTYSDGTRVTQDPNQVVNFFGLAFYYTFQ